VKRTEYAKTIEQATDVLSQVLADGPMPGREARREGDRRLGRSVDARVWQSARERAGVVTEKVGRTWWW
jgi:hypothetical protein